MSSSGDEKEMMGNLAKLATAIDRASAKQKQAMFLERRAETRLWCSDLVQVWWKDARWKKKGTGILEDISPSGVCVQMEDPLPPGTAVRIKHPEFGFEGEVRYCVYREEGYFLGILLNESSKWSDKAFKPKHLMDPSKVAPKKKPK